MRTIDPFSYFWDHASAVPGFGGERRSPDPQYCFHTHYESVRPGRATYVIRLYGVTASQGELTVRVHALRETPGANATLVAGSRLDLNVGTGKQDLAASVGFHALRGVTYAFYGFFSEYSDISAERIEVLLDEPAGEQDVYVEAPHSVLLTDDGDKDVRPANALIHGGAASLDHPVSQDCTWRQLAQMNAGSGIGGTAGANDDLIARWRERVCINALPRYGVPPIPVDGWLVGSASHAMRASLKASNFVVWERETLSPKTANDEFADFIVSPAGFPMLDGAEARWALFAAWLQCLKVGGVAAIGLRHAPANQPTSSELAAADGPLAANEIGRWVLRLIGMGFSTAPLAFAPRSELPLDSQGLASIVLIMRRDR